jgi:hypothetical protein
MLNLKTPVDRIYRMTLELANSVTDLQEGEWVSPSTTNGNLFVRTGSAEAAKDTNGSPTVAFLCWLDQKRPDAQASGLVGSGTIATPFGKFVAETDMIDKSVGMTYAAGDLLTVKLVGGKALLSKAGATDNIFAKVLVAPANLAATGARLKFVVE